MRSGIAVPVQVEGRFASARPDAEPFCAEQLGQALLTEVESAPLTKWRPSPLTEGKVLSTEPAQMAEGREVLAPALGQRRKMVVVDARWIRRRD